MGLAASTRRSAQELQGILTIACSWWAMTSLQTTGRFETAGRLIGERMVSSAFLWARTHAALLMKLPMLLQSWSRQQSRFELIQTNQTWQLRKLQGSRALCPSEDDIELFFIQTV